MLVQVFSYHKDEEIGFENVYEEKDVKDLIEDLKLRGYEVPDNVNEERIFEKLLKFGTATFGEIELNLV